MKSNPAVFWLRQDFRILRNNALSYASNNHDYVSAIYIFKKKILKKKRKLKSGGYMNP